jgi:hypothetical protein
MQFLPEIWRWSEYIQAFNDFSKLIRKKSLIRRQRVKDNFEAVEAYSEAVEAYFVAADAHLRAIEAHSGSVGGSIWSLGDRYWVGILFVPSGVEDAHFGTK